MTELQQILPYYLNTGVKVKCTIDGSISNLISVNTDAFTIKGKIDLKNGTDVKNELIVDFTSCFNSLNEFRYFKLLCRPLSDLNKEITVQGYNEGKPFVPIEELLKISDSSVEEEFIDLMADDISFIENKMDLAPFSIIKKLISWHFWIGSEEGFKQYCEEIK